MALEQLITEYIAPLGRTVMSMIFGSLTTKVDDTTNLQLLNISSHKDLTMKDIERISEYRFTSVPPDGSEAVVVCISGNRDHPVIIATDSSTYRKNNLSEGDVCVYNNNSDYILLKANGDVVIKNSGKIRLGDETLTETSPGTLNDGVVTSQTLDTLTGLPLLGSTKVYAKKL